MSNDMNSVSIIGRLTQDIGADERSFGYIGNGLARANVNIAVNKTKKSGDQWIDEVSYFTVVIWGRTAENLKPYLTKGKQIAVRGYLKQDRWEKNGQKNSRVSIVAEDVQLLGGNSDTKKTTTTQHAPSAPVQQQETQQNVNVDYGLDFPEDIPF